MFVFLQMVKPMCNSPNHCHLHDGTHITHAQYAMAVIISRIGTLTT